MTTKNNYIKYIGIGFLIGFVLTIMSIYDILNSLFGWFYNAPYLILDSISPCYAASCLEYGVITWIFWPILGIIIGFLIARRKQKIVNGS